ncbi:hypothetical protein HYW11_03820, partial [Candidatus Peregrinibacteria bacterium]|nr:hypothetical protein [Candidatus Peregrinibacteria bacterium]
MGSRSSVKMWQQRFTDAKFLLSAVTILAMLAPDLALAENRYWKGAVDADWNNIYNWAVDENAAPNGAAVPAATDIVIFTSNNGTKGSGGDVFIKRAVDIAGLVLAPSFTGSVFTGTSSILIGSKSGGLRMGSGRLGIGATATVFSISGSLTMTGGVFGNGNKGNKIRLSGSLLHQRGALSFSGHILFNNNHADQTLRITNNPTVSATYKYAKATLSGITLNNTAGTTIDDLSLSGATLFLRSITIDRGNLDLTKYGVNLSLSGSMIIASNANAGFSASTQTLTVSGSIDKGSSGYIYMSGGTLLMNGSRDQALNLANSVIHNLTISNVGSANSDNIIVANGSQLLLSGTLTINNGNLNLMDNTEVMVVERGITLANDADAQLTTNSNIFASGTITVNSSAVLAITGGTLTLNDKGDQTINLNGKRIFSLEIDNGGSANDDSVFVANGSQLLLSGALTVTNGTLNLMDNTEAMIVRRNITLANDADAIIASNSTIIASGSISTGASASWAITGATITLNGNTRRQAIDFDNAKMMAFTVTNTSSGVLTSNATVLGTLTINTGSLLAFGANTLYATGSSIVNYGQIKEDTGKIYHTGSNMVVGN